MGLVFPFTAIFVAWVFAARGAEKLGPGPRALLSLFFGAGYVLARALGGRGVGLATVAAGAAFGLACFAVLSFLRRADGLVSWLLATAVGALVLFFGVPMMEHYLREALLRRERRLESDDGACRERAGHPPRAG